MSKLSLHPDQLEVQSFPTTDAEWDRRGTVRGHSGATCDQDTCNSCPNCTIDQDTCFSCPLTCAASCQTCPVSCNPAQCPSADGRC
ncbi:MAG TPA: hypothetical protein VFX98_16985 [Longimicrobiaceae bacterium]|nr:hypothetical protein [Longimicrobiaceae bacterium]